MYCHTKQHILEFRSIERMLAFFSAVKDSSDLGQAERWSFLQRIAWRDMKKPPIGPAGTLKEDKMVDCRLFIELRNGDLFLFDGREESFSTTGYAFCEEPDLESVVNGLGWALTRQEKVVY